MSTREHGHFSSDSIAAGAKPVVRRRAARELLGALAIMALAPAVCSALSTENAELQAALRATPRLDRGAEDFDTCAACHGRDGGGASDGTIPAIAGQHESVLVRQLIEFRHNARLNIRMQHFVDRHHLTDAQQLADVAAYVSSLPPRSVASGGAVAPPGSAATYARRCRSCHGGSGEGDAAMHVPRLAGQHPEYLGEQLHDAAEGRRPSMRGHTRLLAKLSTEEIDGLAVYLANLGPTRGAAA